MRSSAAVFGITMSHYKIDGRLGEDGMGVVYSAAEGQDPGARRPLAEAAR